MMWGSGFGWGAMGLGWIFMILFWVFVIAGLVWLALAISGQTTRREGTGSRGALDILEERLARGEIDVEEYRTRMAALGSGR